MEYATAARESKEAKGFVSLDERNLEWAILMGGGWQGFRKNEIISCRWEWFAWDEGLLRVRELKASPEFKLKTRQALHPHRKSMGFVFETHRLNQGKHRYRFDLKKGLTVALDDLGLSTSKPYQRLRQTFINLHMESGKSARLVAQWAGNSPEVIERHYEGRLHFREDPNCY